MTAKQLQRADAAYRASMERTEQLRQARNAAIREALAEGKTQVWIAEALGVTQGRVGQIVNNST